jgi:hypothetical protein
MAYEGMAAATDLIRTSLPAWDRVFARQPSILLRTLSLMLWKAAVFELPNKIGRPRYMESVGLEVNGRIFRMVEEVVGLVFLLNLMEDLVLFMDWPDHKQYLDKQVFMQQATKKENKEVIYKRRW